MLASSLNPARRAARGFTLFELLVVLAIASLMAGVVLPGLGRTAERVRYASDKRQLLGEIAALGLRANAGVAGFTLDGTSLGKPLADGKPMLDVPDGWRVRVETPIEFSFSGACSGGSVELIDPDGAAEPVVLPAPTCRVASS